MRRASHLCDASRREAAVCVAGEDGLPLLLELNPAQAEGPIRIRFDDWRPNLPSAAPASPFRAG